MQDVIREYIVVALDIARRRWLLLCLPVGVAILLALVAIRVAPTKYEAKSLILLQSANRAAGVSTSASYTRQNTLEQVAAVEAWIKSDHVLKGLLPRLVDTKDLAAANEIFAQIKIIRASLTLELVGGSALEVTLQGPSPVGLGRKLEIIVGRLMEGLTGPEQSILNANQFVSTRRREDAVVAETQLNRAITIAGFREPDVVKGHLRRLSELDKRLVGRSPGAGPATGGSRADVEEIARQAEAIRSGLGVDRRTVSELERLFNTFQAAVVRAEETPDRSSAGGNNYVGIFDSPENLLLVGRPQDPMVGESAARKLAVVGVLLSIICGAALVFAVEMLGGRIRTRSEFESIAELPVLARFTRLP